MSNYKPALASLLLMSCSSAPLPFPLVDIKPFTTTVSPIEDLVEKGVGNQPDLQPEPREDTYSLPEEIKSTEPFNYFTPLRELGICEEQRKIVVDKSERLLTLYCGDTPLKEYPVSLGFTPEGSKEQRGDGKTPEGEYYVVSQFPHPSWHKALYVSYPNKEDALQGKNKGIINDFQYRAIVRAKDNCTLPSQNTKLGSEILIHGGGSGMGIGWGPGLDWTLGCVALEDQDIAEIYSFSQAGCIKKRQEIIPRTKVIIKP